MPESSGITSDSSMGIKSFSVKCTRNLPLLITHPLLSGDVVWLNQNSRGKIRVAHPVRDWTPPVHQVTCHVTPGACPLFYEQKGTTCTPLHLSEVWVGPPGHTPSFKKENQGEGDVGPQANKIYSN